MVHVWVATAPVERVHLTHLLARYATMLAKLQRKLRLVPLAIEQVSYIALLLFWHGSCFPCQAPHFGSGVKNEAATECLGCSREVRTGRAAGGFVFTLDWWFCNHRHYHSPFAPGHRVMHDSDLTEPTTPIRHADTPFAVSLRVDMAPAQMQEPELHRNALEAAVQAARGKGLIEWRATEYLCSDGTKVPKLTVFNTGPGMDSEELKRVMDLASSGGGKKNGLKDNFGMGAKVTGLKNNPLGMRYRSCCNGVASEVTIGKRGEEYVMLRKKVAEGEYYEVTDVTEICRDEKYSLDEDWTEVMLLGQSEKHDTVKNPYDAMDSLDTNWLVKSLNQRFLSFSDSVRVRLDSSVSGSDKHTRHITGLSGISKYTDRAETVTAAPGVSLTYRILKPRKNGGAGWSHYGYQPHICLTWKNECYDITSGVHWHRVAPRYGVAWAPARVSVEIHLADDAPVIPDQYRQFLQWDNDEMQQVECEEFAKLVEKARPDWLVEFIANQAPTAEEESVTLRNRLADLLKDYEWKTQTYRRDKEGDTEMPAGLTANSLFEEEHADEAAEPKEKTERPETVSQVQEKRGRPAGRHNSKLPKRKWDKGGTAKTTGYMSQRACHYDHKLHELVLNEDYEGIEISVRNVVDLFPGVASQDELRNAALRGVKEEFVIRGTKAVMMALVHRGDPHWSTADVQRALTDECLTVALDDTRDIENAVKRRLTPKFGAAKK